MSKLIAMQANLGLGHKGEIILTTQERVDKNQPMIAKDIIDAEHADRFVLCWNSHDDLLKRIEKLEKGLKVALFKQGDAAEKEKDNG